MKKLIGGLGIIVSLLLMGFNISFAEGSEGVAALRGRDIAEKGKVVSVEGVLKMEGVEWVLISGDKEYDIHLGPVTYREDKGFQLVAGNQAVVKGFLIQDQIAVMEISSNGDHIVLRGADGRPAWSGSRFARGRNRDADHDHDGQNPHGSNQEVPGDLESLDNLGDI